MVAPRHPVTPSSGKSSVLRRGGRTSTFPIDHGGRPALPTFAALEKTNQPEDKLAIASQLADIIQIQADTAVSVGASGRLADLLFHVGRVLDALGDVVEPLADTEAEPAADPPALRRQQRPLTSILATVHGTLSQIVVLSKLADPAKASRIAARFRLVDGRATALAARTGLSWRPFGPAGAIDLSDTGRRKPAPSAASPEWTGPAYPPFARTARNPSR